MNLKILGLAAFFVAGSAAAMAADLTAVANNVSSPMSSSDWSGFYVGLTAGAVSQQTDVTDYWCWYACDAPAVTATGLLGGLTAGANFQMDENFMVGFEADWSLAGNDASETSYDENDTWTFGSKINSIATLRGRAGLAVNNTLAYVTAGAALADMNYYMTTEGEEGWGADGSGMQLGSVAGVGIEHKIDGNLSIKAEYLHVMLPTVRACYEQAGVCSDTPNQDDDNVFWSPSIDIARVGLNMSF